MDPYKKYLLETVLFAICVIAGFDFIILFTLQENWLLTSLAVIFTYVSLDNLFCGRRAKASASGITTHYIIPWRIKKKN